ncbi:MAG: pseudouridine synthase [Helicobacteraceae bacterium]
MRLNKRLAVLAGCSRRKADELIFSGAVSVDKRRVVNPGFDAPDGAQISLNGKTLKPKDGYTAIIYHKPKGELVSTKDDRNRRTIYDTLGAKFKSFMSVGRLDYASSGLLILSDSRAVVHKLESSRLAREYNVKFKGALTREMEEAMQQGLFLEDALKGAHQKTKIKSMEFKPFLGYKILNQTALHTRLRVSLNEGQNRELRRFFAHFDRELLDLARVSFGEFFLNGLPAGKFRFFSKDEYKILHEFMKEQTPGSKLGSKPADAQEQGLRSKAGADYIGLRSSKQPAPRSKPKARA